MFKTDSFLGNKKSSSNQNVWRDHATMQQDVLLHFWVIFLYWNQTEIWKNVLLSSSRAFSLPTPRHLGRFYRVPFKSLPRMQIKQAINKNNSAFIYVPQIIVKLRKSHRNTMSNDGLNIEIIDQSLDIKL